MTRPDVCAQIETLGIIPAVRCSSSDDALFAVETLAAYGLPIAEITLTVPGALGVMGELRRRHTGIVTGAGSIVDSEAARRAADSGALFLTSPGLDPETVRFAVENEIAVFPGVLTPSDIMAAWKL